jgi:hypothetical protein
MAVAAAAAMFSRAGDSVADPEVEDTLRCQIVRVSHE